MGNDHTSSPHLVTSAASGHVINLRAYLAGSYTLSWAAQPNEPEPTHPKKTRPIRPEKCMGQARAYFLDPCRNSTGGYPFASSFFSFLSGRWNENM
jgi:hypothetical protein